MQVMLLGTAAGGGFPQWNCWCPSCRVARSTPARARPRMQSSIAVSADGKRWFLCNASPDVREQVSRLPTDTPAHDVTRSVPIEGVVLTDAELDHSLGLVLLREARRLTVYATAAVERILERDTRILPTVRAFAEVSVVCLPPGVPIPLLDRAGADVGLTVEAFDVGGDPPRFATDAGSGHTVGLTVREPATDVSLAFVPGAGMIDASLRDRLGGADMILFDGTFWSDDELIALGISPATAYEIGHVPISGAGGSLAALRALAPARRVYTHINNSNPILVEDSAERRAVEEAGMLVGMDGMHFTLGGLGDGLGQAGVRGTISAERR